ncbi:binary toxin-like calcium binding domain-containing protein [Frigoribacterium sp. Leaf164]|uniref:binary toxin-like calcium binding domain-containing protein n=1 Tax=Frigoribacterium sp. Leaf164 TaxID=1736282 RepID=UPI0009EADFE9|nr:binary toxin-like calcium binding domain-containing protein [Frigoribacterium sp. Leaf164]
MRHPIFLTSIPPLVAAVLGVALVADALTPPPQAASASTLDGPPPPAGDSGVPADEPFAGTAPLVTALGGGDSAETVSVSWRSPARVPAGATTITLDAAVTTELAGPRSFAVLRDGVGPDVASPDRTADEIVTVETTPDRPTTVRLSVEAPPEGTAITLGWSSDAGSPWQPVAEADLSTPVVSSPGARAGLACGAALPGDRDHDLVPDDLERGGYALVDSSLVPWRDDLAARGHTKYLSDPNHCRSARDPYTDLEKVSAMMPGGTRTEARDPLVAAAPAVGVDLEKLVVTLNDTTSESTTRTRSLSTTNSWSRTLGGKVGVESGASAGPEGLSGETKVSQEFNFSWTRSHSVTEGTSTSWQELVTRSASKAASLNGNVRYHNAGSAPVFDAHPTTSWVLEGQQTMASFRAGPNFRADALGAGESYPARGSAALSVETINDAGTVDLTATADELEQLGRSGEVSLDTPQTSGTFGRVVSGRLDPAAGQWGPVLTGIRESTATLVLDAGIDTAQRHVVAPDLRDPDDSTPRLTIGEAIDRAFAVERIDGHRWYRSPDLASPTNRAPLLLDERAVLLTMDEATGAAVRDQQRDGRSVYDVELRRGMQIGIKSADQHSDFDDGDFSGWTGHASTPGTVRPAGAGEISWTKEGLTPGHRYRVSFRSKNAPSGSSSTMWLDDPTHQVPLDRAPTPPGWTSRPTFVEFTAATTTVRLHGRAEIDDLSFFSLGASRRADISWVSRMGDDLAIPDTTTPLTTQVDVLSRGGAQALDLLVGRSGRAIDLSTSVVEVTGPALGAWSTGPTYKARGHVNLPVVARGTSTVTVYSPRQGSTAACDYCLEPIASLTVDVGASKPATVAFHYREGASKHMCTVRFRALETPGFRGEVAESVDFRSNSHSCKNDDAYYVSFTNMPIGTELSVFDSPDGSRNDDFFIWETTVPTSGLLWTDARERPAGVTVQEQSYRNGLVGKVSRFELHYPGTW